MMVLPWRWRHWRPHPYSYSYSYSACIPLAQHLGVPMLSPSNAVPNPPSRRHLLLCTHPSPGELLQFSPATCPSPDFCSFIESTPRAEIVDFFRSIVLEVEEARKIGDFHMRIVDCADGFKVSIYYGFNRSGPIAMPLAGCISCYPTASFFPGEGCELKAGDCILEEYADEPNAVCRLDAKGRSGFVITPLRHVERMSELNDEELVGLWSLAVRALRTAELPFTSMRLNHGTYRNHEHLHLKVWVDEDMYQKYCRTWAMSRQELWKRLRHHTADRRRLKHVQKEKKTNSIDD